MSNSSKLGKILIKNNIEFVTGVPDSLLKPFIQKLKKVLKTTNVTKNYN